MGLRDHWDLAQRLSQGRRSVHFCCTLLIKEAALAAVFLGEIASNTKGWLSAPPPLPGLSYLSV